MLSDPISDFLTRIRNASLVSKESVVIPHSKLKEKLTELLVNEGYLTAYKLVGDGVSKSIKIELIDIGGGIPVEYNENTLAPTQFGDVISSKLNEQSGHKYLYKRGNKFLI